MSRTTRPLNDEEQAELNSWLEIGMDVMIHYGVDEFITIYDNLDAIYEAWVDDSDSNKPSVDAVLLGLATVFGDRMAHKHSTSWHIVVDEHGEIYAMAVRDYEIYPIDFVAKRIATLETDEPEFGFFSGMADISDTWQ